MQIRKLAGVICLIVVTDGAHAQGLTTQAISKIRQEAIELCGDFKLDGSGTSVEAGAKVELKARGLLSWLTDAGVEAAAKVNKDSFSNVVRDKLADELKSNRDCRQEMFKFMADQLALSQQKTPQLAQPQANTQQAAQPLQVPQPQPAFTVAGVWRYSGTCPNPYGYGTEAVYGDIELWQQGGTLYAGRAVSSLGVEARFQSELIGNILTSRTQWSDGSYVIATGYLQPGGLAMKIEDTSGCFSTAQKLR